MIENNEILGARIKRRREEMNISVAEIAEQTGLSRATIHRYESGDIKRLKLPVIESIAEMLNVTPEMDHRKNGRPPPSHAFIRCPTRGID